MSWITDEVKVGWAVVKAAFTDEAATAETALSNVEQKYLPAFSAWATQMGTVIKGQALVILEDGITAILATLASGGNVGAAIAALVPQVVAQAKADLGGDVANIEQTALNAAHTAIGLAIANAPAPAAA